MRKFEDFKALEIDDQNILTRTIFHNVKLAFDSLGEWLNIYVREHDTQLL